MRLARKVAERRLADPDASWTARLIARGPGKCAEKFGEEAVEAIVAAAAGTREELAEEAADVLYHLLVMLEARDVALEDVLAVLEARGARSGLEEKRSRGSSGGGGRAEET